uniref:SH2 domain-containing protein n=1 Tax=Aliivibrio phage vB_Alvi_H905 TaxID=3234039 RepID=A0AB39C9S2_9VIRU
MNSNQLSDEQLQLIRQWFDAVQDLNPSVLKKEDYILAKSIYESLGLRVPNSINDVTVAICSSKKELNNCSFKPEQPGVYLLRASPLDKKPIQVGVMWMDGVLATSLLSYVGNHISVDDIPEEWEWKIVVLSEDVNLINQYLFPT